MTENSNKIYAKIKETKSSMVLIDYRAVNFNISQGQAFNTIRYYENKIPALAKVIIVAVVNEANRQIGATWGAIAAERGFRFKVFTDYEEAEKWLLLQST